MRNYIKASTIVALLISGGILNTPNTTAAAISQTAEELPAPQQPAISGPITAESGRCLDSQKRASSFLNQAWLEIRSLPPSVARDSVWSAYDFSKEFTDVMLRIPGKFDRTKGLYYEERDRAYYAYRLVFAQRWPNPNIQRYVSYAYQEIYYNLAGCYAGALAATKPQRRFRR